jgi:hypothetical protein
MPFEANPPLLIDADAELAGTVACQRFEAVTPERPQLFQIGRSVKNLKTAIGLSREPLEFSHKTATGKRRSPIATIAQDH